MRRIVGSCLGARWRLPVMPVQPRRQSVCFRQAWRVFYPHRVYTLQHLLLSRCSQMHTQISHNQSSVCGSKLRVLQRVCDVNFYIIPRVSCLGAVRNNLYQIHV